MPDYFNTFGIDRTFGVDRERLETRFHSLQSASHPDRHVSAEADRREKALTDSSDINAAYRTLRDAIPRAKHLLDLYGFPISEQKRVPQTLLTIVMDAQEKIAEMEATTDRQVKTRMIRELGAVAEELEGRRLAIDGERSRIARSWDIQLHSLNRESLSTVEQELLGRMAQLLSERSYLETLHWSVQAAQEGKPAFIQH